MLACSTREDQLDMLESVQSGAIELIQNRGREYKFYEDIVQTIQKIG